ncbi:hypothetical protein KAR91_85570, partial [Candidatus Pacearchaeota archaeon]|nr:hypothetical protein [Candidatus Pacearchaeota archaeon]
MEYAHGLFINTYDAQDIISSILAREDMFLNLEIDAGTFKGLKKLYMGAAQDTPAAHVFYWKDEEFAMLIGWKAALDTLEQNKEWALRNGYSQGQYEERLKVGYSDFMAWLLKLAKEKDRKTPRIVKWMDESDGRKQKETIWEISEKAPKWANRNLVFYKEKRWWDPLGLFRKRKTEKTFPINAKGVKKPRIKLVKKAGQF